MQINVTGNLKHKERALTVRPECERLVGSRQEKSRIKDTAGRDLTRACIQGNALARAQFQREYGELIYSYSEPRRGSGPQVEGGDLYLYAFEDDRIYKRLASFEGRATLRRYLLGYALPDLAKHLLNKGRRDQIESLDQAPTDALELHCTAGEIPATLSQENRDNAAHHLAIVDAGLPASKRLLLKLLFIEDYELEADDLATLADINKTTVRATARDIETVRADVRRREMARHRRLDRAADIAGRILEYQRNIVRLQKALLTTAAGTFLARDLHRRIAELRRKETWRRKQQARLLRQGGSTVTAVRSRTIARLLREPEGTVRSRIARIRDEMRDILRGTARPTHYGRLRLES